jgi:hypothetical protein
MSSCQPGIEETDLIEEQVDYWNEGSSIDLQEESRYGTSMLWRLDFSKTKIGTVLVLPKYMVNRLSNVIAQSFCCSIFITLFVIVFF